MADERLWNRLTPETENENDLEGLRAEVHDPLWALGRQWQVGEMQGEDGGSPVRADAWVERDRVSKYDLGGGPTSYDPADAPLETIVERETMVTGRDRPDMGEAVESGLHFLRLLDRYGHRAGNRSPSADDFDATYHVTEDDYEAGVDVPESQAARRFEMVVDRRALDGYDVYHALVDRTSNLVSADAWDDGSITWPGASNLPAPGSTVDDAYKRAAKTFVDWYGDRYDEPAGGDDAWDESRLEYDFDVATGDAATETVFSAGEYQGGHLDWASFDVDPSASLHGGTPSGSTKGGVTETVLSNSKSVTYAADPASTTTKTGTTAVERPDVARMPASVSYPGMPAARWWEFEDGTVNLFGADVGPGHLGKELLIDFAITYGEDWFSVPVEMPVGSLSRVTALAVVDSFGVMDVATSTLEAANDVDLSGSNPAPDAAATDWKLFTDFLPDHHEEPGLFVPPTLGEGFESDPVEEVVFARDELANLAWAIEERIEDPYGIPIDVEEFTDPSLSISGVTAAADPADESVVLENPGDEPLRIGEWTLVVHRETDNGSVTESFEFGASPGDVVVPPESEIRVIPDIGPDTGETLYWKRDQQYRDASLLSDATKLVVRNGRGKRGWPVAYRDLATGDDRPSLSAYRLASDVRDHWYPLKPLQSGDGTTFEMKDTTFALARLVDADLDALPTPKGRILDPYVPETASQPVPTIHDEELTRAGVSVTRTYQLARWIGGSTHRWSARKATTGPGQGSSGLRYDYLESPDDE